MGETRSDGVKLTADDRAAGEFIRRKIDEHWLKVADGWTTQFQLRNYFGEVLPGEPDLLFKQYRELKFTLRPEELTETMRLNGTDYRCVAEFQQSPMRYYRRVATFDGPQGWSQWSDGDLMFRMIAIERRNGEWLIQDDDLFVNVKPQGAAVPSST